MPWEEEKEYSLSDAIAGTVTTDFRLLIGPEGGFTREEAELARRAGAITVSLGPRTLRAETAALATTAAILFARGELDAR
jgi:16S rRNA (uracil1498-N3)-methyltransferase